MGLLTDSFSRTRSMVQNFSWALLGNIIYSGCQWGILVALAKLGTPGLVGQYSLGLALTAPIILFANLQLRGVQATDADSRYSLGDYLGVRLTTTAAAAVVITGVIVVRGFTGSPAAVILLIGAAKCVESLSDVVQGFLQKHERMDLIARSLVAKGLVSLCSFTVAVYLTRSVLWAVVTMLGSWTLVLITFDLRYVYKLAKQLNSTPLGLSPTETVFPVWDKRKSVALIWRSLPLGLVAMLLSLNANIPRYYVKDLIGDASLGIYSAVAYVLVAGSTVVSALSQTAIPRLARHYVTGNLHDYLKLLKRLLAIAIAIGAVFIVVVVIGGRHLLSILYTAEYARANGIFVVLMASAAIGFVASSLGCAMTAAQYYSVQFPLFLIVTLSTLVFCAVLVPKFGMMGAAYSDLLSSAIQVVGSAFVVRHAVVRLRSRADCSEGG